MRRIDEFRRSKNTDWLNLVVGPRGTGKSNFALWCAMQLVPEESIRIVHTGEEFLTAINEIPRYGMIVYDEGLRGMMSRQAMSTDNIEQIKAVAQMRQNKNIIMMFITQDIQMVERHIRTAACNGVMRCTFKNNRGLPIQGMVLGYGPKKVPYIKADTMGHIKWGTPDWADGFPSIADTELWKKYEKMEGEQKESSNISGKQKILNRSKSPEAIIQKRNIEEYVCNQRKLGKTFRHIAVLVYKKFGVVKDHVSYITMCKKAGIP